MHRGRSHWRAPLAATVLLALAACSSKEPNTCPRVAVLADSNALTRFAPGAGRNILDIDYEVKFADVVNQCEFKKKDNRRSVKIAVTPIFAVSRGPANTSRKAEFTYFISVVRGEQILTKEEFPLLADFPENRTRIAVQDSDPPIVVDVPLPYREAEWEYEVILGLQLTEAELAYNRSSRGRGR